jgi:hypothetical protein
MVWKNACSDRDKLILMAVRDMRKKEKRERYTKQKNKN